MTSSAGTRMQMQTSEEKHDRELLEEIAGNTRVMAVKLFGSSDADSETSTGRLPKVESSTRRAHERIDAINVRMAYWAGAVAAIAFLIQVVFKK